MLIVLGIAIGVAVMVFITALIDGLQADLIEKTVGRAPHIILSSAESDARGAETSKNGNKVLTIDMTQNLQRSIAEWNTLEKSIQADSRSKAVLPVIEGSGLIRRGQITRSVMLKGLDLTKADRIYHITQSITAGNSQPSSGSVLIGSGLATVLAIKPGDPFILELPSQTPLTLTVEGIFDLGVSAINERWLIMDQHQAGALLGIGDAVTSIEIQIKDVFSAEEISQTWSVWFPGYKIESWQKTNATLLTALKSQSSSSYMIQFFVLVAVILGVSSVLAISAVQKFKQIGILKAMGIRTSSVARVFLFQGIVLGILGALLGFALGLLMARLFIIFAGQQLTLLLKPSSITVIMVATISSATLSAFLPARRVSQLNPIEVIRNG